MLKEKLIDIDQLERLLNIMATLRDPQHGCPWDVAQTMASLTRYTIEEAYEVADAIARNDPAAICDELGDLLFQIVFYAQVAKEKGDFEFNDVARAVSDKMVRRHPHVFSKKPASGLPPETPVALNKQWEAIKAQEKRAQGTTEQYHLDDVPEGLPALMYAQKLQQRCAKVGFDWNDIAPVLAKVREEIEEIQQEIDADEPSPAAIEEEIGDALFALVNLARHSGVDADTALRNASHKFRRRFNGVEKMAVASAKGLQDLSLEDMEKLWQAVKMSADD
ncbi:nucleoside triphosphate pyrophosphohydrolase [Alteromonas pelagimontana]|uniref:Nucleoside triphosphate pyrophosphohydrolase n=1 Tax=Alteromonas pelagimontana TaxID=1858656 RepID=A0A6M4MAR8_9ALTE|nr:nucleoside triphosphate pyrophosphohydrolase [Alteromonas pelagimontana]QJR80263.1 nucleoside triphosphate pyrophosphohydrolase [Alteromonas pelagimontana]